MFEGFFSETLPSFVQNVSLLSFILIYLGGVLTSISPCILSMVPVMIGYIGGYSEKSRLKGFIMSMAFVLGLSVTFALLGILAALLGQIFGQIGQGWYYIIAAVAIIMGLHLLGVINISFPTLKKMPIKSKGVIPSFFIGMLFGLVASPCATPVLAVIMTYIAAQGNLVTGGAMLFVYGLGHGLPLIIAGTFAAFLTSLDKFQQWTQYVTRISLLKSTVQRPSAMLISNKAVPSGIVPCRFFPVGPTMSSSIAALAIPS